MPVFAQNGKAVEGIDSDDFDDFLDDIDNDNELEPSKYFSKPTQIIPRSSPVHETQPTQIIPKSSAVHHTQATQLVNRTSLKPKLPLLPSSPRSVVEVPASPGVQRSSNLPPKPKLPLAIAPAGTAFRNPLAAAPSKKRAYIDISDDDLRRPTFADSSSDDDGPARGTIQPSSFVSKKATGQQGNLERSNGPPKPPKQTVHRQINSRLEQLVKKLHKEARGRLNVSEDDCRKAVDRQAPTYDYKRALQDLLDRGAEASPSSQQLPTKENKFSNLVSSSKTSQDTQRSTAPAPNPAPRRGRLIQGRRLQQGRPNRESSPPSSPFAPDPIAEAPAKIIDLISSGEDDDFAQAEDSSPAPPKEKEKSPTKIAHEERVLKYLNSCDKVQLMQIAKVPAVKAEAMLKHKPFGSIEEGRKVTMMHKTQKKASKVAIGDEVMDAIEEFINHLQQIDYLVDVCDTRGKKIRAVTSRWNLDIYGQSRTSDDSTSEEPLTPSSRATSVKNDELVPPPVPKEPELMQGHCQLKSYQLYGLNWLKLLFKNNVGAILADDMGLGKTCQVISLLCAVTEEYNNSPHKSNLKRPWPNLVVVPPSTLGNWAAEFENFAPGLNVVMYKGSQGERDELYEEWKDDSSELHVILTTYTQVGRYQDALNLAHLRTVINVFDEGHNLKNPQTQLYKRLKKINGTWRLMLTGTPIQNNLMEMIGLLSMLEPALFETHFGDLENLFSQKVTMKDVSEGALDFDDRVTRARSILEPFILQRKKEQVLELPKKTHTVIHCDLHKAQRPIYEGFEKQFRNSDGTKEAAADKINTENNPWIQTRKAALHPYLFRRFYTDDKVEKLARTLWKNWPPREERPETLARFIEELKQYSDFELHLWCRDHKAIASFDIPEGSLKWSGKVQKLLELIREYKENGDRVLIFSRFAMTVPILHEVLEAEGIKNRQFQGSTDVSERQELIEEFNDDPSITAFIITTGSGATGINLTSANKVIIFDPSDNPQTDIQAENRAHRIGQTRPVEIIRLVTKGTVEELILAAGNKKIELARKVTGENDGESAAAAVTMTDAELKKTVRQAMLGKKDLGVPTPESDD